MTYGEGSTHVFYNDGTIIDFIHPNTGKSVINGNTLEEMQDRYPDTVIMEKETAYNAALLAQYERYAHGPQRIAEDDYTYALEVLPPLNWVTHGNATTFKMSEFQCGRLTNIYAHIGDKYFVLCDNVALKHDDIVKMCLAV